MTTPRHPGFDALTASWDLTLDSDHYAKNTRASYMRAVNHLAGWLPPDVSQADLTRDHVRAWIVHVRQTTSSGTARSLFAGVRHFCRWMVAEGEAARDATDGIKTPPPNDPHTPVLATEDILALLATCTGNDFLARRDKAILYLFVDGGLRLAEMAALNVSDVDIRTRSVTVVGKGTNRSGPRRRQISLGVKATQALDRYIRERRRHPYADLTGLWLGARNRPNLSADGIERMLQRRAELAGVNDLHPHVFRHTWASEFRIAGGSDGDLMALGGWRSRAMLDRYGKAAAAERAMESYRRLSLGDRL